MKPVRTLLVANPTAQSGQNAGRIERARLLFERAGLNHEFLATLPGGKTVDAVRDALREGSYDTAVYMGGDGTFAEVAKGILASTRAADVRLGMLPTGTANDQGKSFGLSSDESDLERNVQVVAEGFETGLDAGRVTATEADGSIVRDDLFFDSAGWGISPRVLALRNEDRRAIEAIPIVRDIYRDQLVYAGAALRTFVQSYLGDDMFDVDLVADGRSLRWNGLSDLIVKGTRIYGGLWVLDPTSKHDDGLFEVVPLAGRRDWISKAIVHLDESGSLSESLNEIGAGAGAPVRAARIELGFHPHNAHTVIAAQIDGEEFAASLFARIEVLPRALRLIVPRSSEP